jgi:RNA polymerase sigma-70 factor, ECF subfamily
MGLFHKNFKNLPDSELMTMMSAGAIRAFDELYHRYSVKLLNYFRKMLNNDTEKAQDFLQDLFIKLLEKSNYYDTSKNFSTWIYTLACNMCKNEYRNHAIRSRIVEENGEAIFYNERMPDLDAIDLGKFKNDLKAELDKLDYAHRETFVLRFYEELSIKEISQILDCAEGTVKSRLFYTLKKLGVRLAAFNPVN